MKPWNKGMKGLKIGFAVIPQPKKHWAKGKTKYTHPSIMSAALLKMNEKNPIWNGGVSQGYLNRIAKEFGIKRDICGDCGSKRSKNAVSLHIHHKDFNRRNNKKSNLVVICNSCHGLRHANKRWNNK